MICYAHVSSVTTNAACFGDKGEDNLNPRNRVTAFDEGPLHIFCDAQEFQEFCFIETECLVNLFGIPSSKHQSSYFKFEWIFS